MRQTVTRLEDVRKPTHSEWVSLGRQIDDSLLATLRSLTDDEWSTPTECEPWTVKDAVAAATAGIPTVAVVTEQFASLAKTLAAQYGRPGLRLIELPFPLDTRPEHEVRQIARDRVPALLDILGAS